MPKLDQEKFCAVAEDAKDVIRVIRVFVEYPDDVRMEVRPGPFRVTVELYTHPDDVGSVVGKNGTGMASIRGLLKGVAEKHKIKIDIYYVTDEDKVRGAKKYTEPRGERVLIDKKEVAMLGHKVKMEEARRSRFDSFTTLFVVVVIVIVLLLGGTVGLTCMIMSEIDDCGGVSKCLGKSVRQFDEARKGE